MRPRGEIRQAMAKAARALVMQHGSFTGREAAMLAQVAFEKARLTLKDMVNAGELRVVGQERVPGVNRPLNRYALPEPRAAAAPGSDLLLVVQRWVDFS